MFETAIAGSLPKPAWLAETNTLWPQWKASGAELDQAKCDATLLGIKAQQDAGLDIGGRRAAFERPGARDGSLFRCTNCGLAPMGREVAMRKLQALAQGAALARRRYA